MSTAWRASSLLRDHVQYSSGSPDGASHSMPSQVFGNSMKPPECRGFRVSRSLPSCQIQWYRWPVILPEPPLRMANMEGRCRNGLSGNPCDTEGVADWPTLPILHGPKWGPQGMFPDWSAMDGHLPPSRGDHVGAVEAPVARGIRHDLRPEKVLIPAGSRIERGSPQPLQCDSVLKSNPRLGRCNAPVRKPFFQALTASFSSSPENTP